MSGPELPVVTCIVLTWNGGTQVQRTLHSLRESAGVVANIILVDNGSCDASAEESRSVAPGATLIQLNHNIGAAAARNIALASALRNTTDYVFFLDDDAFCASDCIQQLVEAVQVYEDVGIVTPRIFSAGKNSTIWYDGGEADVSGDTRHRNFHKRVSDLPPGANDMSQIAFATSCAMLVSRRALDATGLFDERYFVYCEDADFSFRVRAAGFRILHLPSAVVWHEQSRDTKNNRGKWFRDYYITRNTLLLMRDHVHGLSRAMFVLTFAVRRLLIPLTFFLVTLEFRRIGAMAIGIVDFVRGRVGGRYS